MEDTVYTYNIIHCFLTYITRRILYIPTIIFIFILHIMTILITPTILFIAFFQYKEDTVYTYSIIHCYLTLQGGYCVHLQYYVCFLTYITRRILYTHTILFHCYLILQGGYCIHLQYYYINITFPARVIVENIIPRNVIINRGAAEVDNHISRDDIFDFHPRRECNIYFIIPNRTLDPLFPECILLLNRPIMLRRDPKRNNAQPLIYMFECN